MFTSNPPDTASGEAELIVGQQNLYGITREKDTNKAFHWFLKSGLKGNATAQYYLGYCYFNAEGTKKNFNKAFEWYLKSAEQDNAFAQCDLGYCYDYAKGTEKDFNKAFELYLKSAKQGHLGAQNNVGEHYEHALGTEKDLNEAFKWYRLSAEQGLPNAQFKLGCFYENGYGTEKNPNEAHQWFQKSANQGYIKSTYWLEKKISHTPAILFDDAVTNSHSAANNKNIPAPVDQTDAYCGSAAFAEGCNHCNLLPFPLYASAHEKRQAGKNIETTNADIVLEQLQRTRFPSPGPQYSIYSFQDLAQHYKLPDCTAVKLPKNCTEDEYRKTVCDALRDDYVLLVPVDCVNEMPEIDNGESAHWALAFAELTEDCISVTQHGFYCKWPISKLFASNKGLPAKNPNEANGSFEDFSFTLFKMKKQTSQKRKFEPNTIDETNKRRKPN